LHNTRALVIGLLCLALGWALFVMGGVSALAQEDDDTSPFDNLAVALVIDVSGSMSYTDPLRLRETAAGMFIDLLGADDLLSVIVFDHEAEVIEPFGPAGSPADKEALMARLFPKLDPRGDTDFVETLKLARAQFAGTDTGDKVPVILLLTDGEPDPYPGAIDDAEFMAGHMELLWEQVGLVAADGILIYTVGFSDEIDPEVIRRISTDTRGQYYILQEPGELLVAFYQALEALKDRRSFLEETVDLGDGRTHTLSFNIGEYIRQLNLVLVGEVEAEEDAMNVAVKPPLGTPEAIDQLLIGGRDNYQTVIISRPEEAHYGEWQVEVTGRGELIALGNADLYLEALLIDPDPSANYPLFESMDIQVEVITREKFEDDFFQLELQVTAPDQSRPMDVQMVPEGNRFRGEFIDVSLSGDYKLSWQLYRGENVLFSSSAVVTVQALPAIYSDFFVDAEGFRLGEEMVVSASLNMGGQRMQEGLHLQVDSFIMHLEYRDGARIEMEIFDSGDREHGNSRQGDGIWSNRLLFDREGSAQAVLTATGSYRDSGFILKRSYSFSVSDPGSLYVRLLPQELWTWAGRNVEVPLEFESRSPFTQTVRISSPTRGVTLARDRLTVPPNDTTKVLIEAALVDRIESGSYYLSMEFEAEDGMTPVQPEVFDFEVLILTRWEAFQKQFSGVGAGVVIAAGLALIIAFFLVVIGGLLNRLYLIPRLRVKGKLYFSSADKFDFQDKKLNLGQPAKMEVVISFNPENCKADFVIDGGEYSHDMIITNSWNDHLPGFLRGWRAFLKRSLVIEPTIRCTPPGVIVEDGMVSTGKILHNGDKFESGGFVFRYQGSSKAGVRTKGKGVNILDGKM